MYPDPKRVRGSRHTVCLDQYEDSLVRSLAEYQGEQVGVLLRQMAVREAMRVLGVDSQVMPSTVDQLAA